jgi:hypothetical protein
MLRREDVVEFVCLSRVVVGQLTGARAITRAEVGDLGHDRCRAANSGRDAWRDAGTYPGGRNDASTTGHSQWHRGRGDEGTVSPWMLFPKALAVVVAERVVQAQLLAARICSVERIILDVAVCGLRLGYQRVSSEELRRRRVVVAGPQVDEARLGVESLVVLAMGGSVSRNLLPPYGRRFRDIRPPGPFTSKTALNARTPTTIATEISNASNNETRKTAV